MKETVIVRKLADYTKKNIAKGYKLDDLKWALLKQGHSRTEVQSAVDLAQKELEEEKAQEKAKKQAEEVAKQQQAIVEPVQEPVKKGFFSRLFGLD